MLVTGQTKKEQKSCRLQTQIVRKEIRPNDEGSIISGIVFDPNGAVVAGAKVILLNVHTKETQEVNSSSEGQFKFIALQPGEYSINIEAMGFNLFKQTRLFLEKQQAIDIGVTLMVSEATVTVGILTENEPLEEQGVKTFKQAYLLKLPLP